MEWISKRAYSLWEEAGWPHGQDIDHWAQAEREREEFERVALAPETKAAGVKKPLIEISGQAPAKAAKPKKLAQAVAEKPAAAKAKAPKAANSKPI